MFERLRARPTTSLAAALLVVAIIASVDYATGYEASPTRQPSFTPGT